MPSLYFSSWIMFVAILLELGKNQVHSSRFHHSNPPPRASTQQGIQRCNIQGRGSGVCKPLFQCPSELSAITDGFESGIEYKPHHCSFNGFMPIVCCLSSQIPDIVTLRPPVPGGPVGIADGFSAPSLDFTCGEQGQPPPPPPKDPSKDPDEQGFSFFVVGGEPAIENAWPWMVLLGREIGTSKPEFFCDGFLINREWILTAAHCLNDEKEFFVRLAEHDHNEIKPIGPNTPIDMKLSQKISHPQYTGIGYHDVALLKMTHPVSFTNKVKPVCLPWGSRTTDGIIGSKVTLTGWGTTYYGGPTSNILLEANVTVFHPRECEENYRNLFDFNHLFPDGMNTHNIICAGDVSGGIDACQGDSGGPLVLREAGQRTFSVVGIVSKGHGCGNKDFPGLYAPVASVLPWIKQVAFSD